MSISNLNIVMGRIMAATASSPIAVFREEGGKFNAIFAATATFIPFVHKHRNSFVGVYYKDSPIADLTDLVAEANSVASPRAEEDIS